MSDYNVFSLFYDDLTKNVKYADRAEYILKLFEKFDRKPTLLLDLACGTGNFSVEFAKRDIEVIGVDISEDMLNVAQEKNSELEKPVMYICQPAEELELFGTVDGAVCLLDSLNHITEYDRFKKAIANVALFLEPERLFIFDLNTVYKHEHILGNNSFKLRDKNIKCFWSNAFDKMDNTVTVRLDFEERTGLFKKQVYSEEFKERAYSDQEIAEALSECDLELLAVYAENTFRPPKNTSQRNIYVTRRINYGKID